jgi:hypothetical protein
MACVFRYGGGHLCLKKGEGGVSYNYIAVFRLVGLLTVDSLWTIVCMKLIHILGRETEFLLMKITA